MMKRFEEQIEEFPGLFLKGLESAEPQKTNYAHLIIVGLGGSGTAGWFLKPLLEEKLGIPVSIIQRWHIPEKMFRIGNPLIILVSYSGNTSEVLNMARFLLSKGIKFLVMTSNGQLARWTNEHKLRLIPLPEGYMPRSTFPMQVGYLWGMLTGEKDVGNHVWLDVRSIKEEARQYVEIFSQAGTAVLVCDEWSAGVGLRWFQQWAENARELLPYCVFPDAAHNALEFLLEKEVVICVVDHAGASEEYSLFVRFIEGRRRKGEVIRIKVPYTGHILTDMLYLCWLGDWISFYLARQKNLTPGPVEAIEGWKRFLKENRNSVKID